MENNNLPSEIKHILLNNIRELCNMPHILAKNPDKDFTRTRLISSFDLLCYLLSQQGQSMDSEVREFFEANQKVIPTKQAIIHQKYKLSQEALPYLFNLFNSSTEQYDNKTYEGHYLFAIDGTSLTLSTNPDSETYLPKQNYNQVLITACFDICNCTYRDLDIMPKIKQNEILSAITMIDRNKFPKKSIFMGDRLYGSLNLLEHINRKGQNYLIRFKDNRGTIKELQTLPLEELDVTVRKELRTTQTNEDKKLYKRGKAFYISGKSKKGKPKVYEQWDFESPYIMTFRIVRVKLDDGNIETLVTNLNPKEFPPDKLKELYHLRWGIETSFRELKYNIGLVNLHSKRDEFAYQEIYSSFIMFNFCQRIIKSAIVEQPNGKHVYKVNVTQGIQICRHRFEKLKDDLAGIWFEIRDYKEPIRPGRKDKRKKIKPKEFVSFTYRVA